MKTFQLPVSDCGCMVVGKIGPDDFQTEDGKPLPENGIIIWYENIETAREAFAAACEAHFGDDDE